MKTGQNAEIIKGDNLDLEFTVLDPDGVTAPDLSAATEIKLTVARTKGGVALVTKTLATITVANSAAHTGNVVTVPIEPADTASLDAGPHVYQARATLAGKTITFAEGILAVLESVND